MALVSYSDSESDNSSELKTRKIEESTTSAPKKGIRRPRLESDNSGSETTHSLPPIPSEFLDLYTTNSRVSVRDDPSLHGGRKRAIPHVEGNWPTHVYLEWYPNNQEIKSLYEVVGQAKANLDEGAEIKSFLYSDLGAQQPLHISLSRPAVLRTEQRHPFSDLIQDAIQESKIFSFRVTVKGLDWVSNFESTRWFLVLRLNKPENNGLNRLLDISNQSLAAFGQPPLYDTPSPTQPQERNRNRNSGRDLGRGAAIREPVVAKSRDWSECFHISIAWSLTKPSVEENERIKNAGLNGLEDIEIWFDTVKIKIGNNILKLPLSAKSLETRGFGGL